MSTTAVSTNRDVAGVTAVVARLQAAQQQESVEDFVALFHPDATWVTGGGRRLIGRAEIAAFTRQVLPGAMKDSTATYEVVHVSFVRDDVAVVAVRQIQVTHSREPLPNAAEGRPTYIMEKPPTGDWRIVHGQNTAVA